LTTAGVDVQAVTVGTSLYNDSEEFGKKATLKNTDAVAPSTS